MVEEKKERKKPKRYLEWCYIPILKGVFVLVVSDDEDWIQEVTQCESTNIYAQTVNGEYRSLDAYFMVLNLWGTVPVYHSIIAHEASHITDFLFKNRGWKIKGGDEPTAYVVEWFVNKANQFLKKHKLNSLIATDNPNQ